MSINDIQQYEAGAFGPIGSRKFGVAMGATAILAGEPVVKTLGATSVTAMATNSPQVGTHYVVGIATEASTQSASADGSVQVQPLTIGAVYVISPKVAATFDTQAEYDALVGKRVLIDLTTGVYTILAADAAGNGCVIEALDVKKYPGKVAFSFRNGASFLA